MQTTRRSFLKMVAGAALAPVVPLTAKAHKPKVGAWPPDEPPRFKVIHVHGGVPWKYAKHYTRWLDKAIDMAGPGDMIFVDRGIHFLDGGLVVPPGKDGLRICGNETAGYPGGVNHRIHLNGQIVIRSNDVTVSCLHFKCGNYVEGEEIVAPSPIGSHFTICHCFFDGSPYNEPERRDFDGTWVPVEWHDLTTGDIYRVRKPDGTLLTDPWS